MLITITIGERHINIKVKYILLVLLIIALFTIYFSVIIKQDNSFDRNIVENENIIKMKSFSINSDSTEMNTSAKGTIYLKEVEGILKNIKIIAWIEIDPNDWGGVTFYIPRKWSVSSIISSYPENKTQAIPADYVSTWITGSTKYEWNSMVQIGRKGMYIPTGGGTGTVVIDLVLNEDEINQSDILNFMIAVGSDEKNGVKIAHPDFIEVPISIMDNE